MPQVSWRRATKVRAALRIASAAASSCLTVQDSACATALLPKGRCRTSFEWSPLASESVCMESRVPEFSPQFRPILPNRATLRSRLLRFLMHQADSDQDRPPASAHCAALSLSGERDANSND